MIKLYEFLDFIRFEKRYGFSVLLHDLVAINKLYFRKHHITKLLDYLDDMNVKITFFILARNLGKNKWLINRLIDSDHEIASHGFKHLLYSRMSLKQQMDDLLMANEEFEKEGITVEGFRPPFFEYNDDTVIALERLGFSYISTRREIEGKSSLDFVQVVDPDDWTGYVIRKMDSQQIVNAWKKAKKGSILIHPWITKARILNSVIRRGKDYRICGNKDSLSISVDVY